MIEIILNKETHREKQVLLLKFPYDLQLVGLARQLPGLAWTKTHNSWYTEYSREILHKVKDLFTDLSVNGEPVKINAGPLKDKLAREKEKAEILVNNALSEEATNGIEKFKNWMRSRRYSDNTIKTYIEALKIFLRFYKNKALLEITNDDLLFFNNEYILKNKLSNSFQNQVVNAIKLFFRTVQNIAIDIELIHRPKRQKLLPNVLSKEEIKLILNAHNNLKHKVMLSLIYSCGLRCGELLRLRPEHIDSKRGVIIIKQAKGRKDRIAPLSTKITEMLVQYFKVSRPETYLFEGQVKGQMYDARSLQLVLKQSLEKAKITKPVSLHWLRHSYATHLLENGTDLRYIQEILGHSSSKTTEIYTHVSTKNIQKIISPFDYL
jgi:integrase/recombinase XerD